MLDGFGIATRLVGTRDPSGTWPVKLKIKVLARRHSQIEVQHTRVSNRNLEPVHIAGGADVTGGGDAERERRGGGRGVVRFVRVGARWWGGVVHGHIHGGAGAEECGAVVSLGGESVRAVGRGSGVPGPGEGRGGVGDLADAIKVEFHLGSTHRAAEDIYAA